MRNLLVNFLLLLFTIFASFILVNAFEVWYADKEARMAKKRAEREHPSNSGPRHE